MNGLNHPEGRVAVITGAAGGIGRAIVKEFLAAGMRVALWDQDRQVLAAIARENPDAILPVDADLTDESAVGTALDRTWSHYGRIDVLVHCVGITGPCRPLASYTLDDWNRTLMVNLTSTFLCARAAVPPLLKSPAGRIVLMASIAGKEGNPGMAAYSASKAAIIALTKSMGKELADTAVRVNCIAPAVIETDLIKQMTPQALEASLSRIPLGRPGTPEEVASMVAWLSSEACSFSTGATFDLSGGRATY